MLRSILLLLLSFTLSNCSHKPQPISYNKDECAHCMMMITDPKFGSELVTSKGKIYKFDSIECLANYISVEHDFTSETLWISDYANPNTLTDATTAFYIVSPKMRSPMGKNIGGFKKKSDMENTFTEMSGQKMKWKDVLNYVKISQ